MMYLFSLLPKNLYIISKSKFAKIDHVQAWKIPYTNNKIFKLFSRAENDTTSEYSEQPT